MESMKDMLYHCGIVMRAYPDYCQKQLMAVNFGVDNFVYNRMVALNNERYHLKKVGIYCEPVAKRLDYVNTLLSNLAEFQNAIPFLNENTVDSLCIANARIHYFNAWKKHNEGKGAGVPTFHKKTACKSYQTNAQYSPQNKEGNHDVKCNVYFTDSKHIRLPKLGRIKIKGSDIRLSRLFFQRHNVRIGTVTISVDSIGRYFISLQLGSMEPFCQPFPLTGSVRGYDVNLSNFYTDSDGNVVDIPQYRKRIQAKLAKAQRVLSHREIQAEHDKRKLTDSKNYQKQRKRVAYLKSRAMLQNDYFQHVLSKQEVESQDFLFTENLRIKSMLQNHNVAYSITDASWGKFFTKLEYKASMYGKTYLQVSSRNTTQTCSDCGYVCSSKNKVKWGVTEWTCPKCGVHHLRDVNAARNILAKGMSACGM